MPDSVDRSPRVSQRLFVALWPDAGVRARLAEIGAAVPLGGGRPVPPQNLHVTLAFLGESDAARRACIEQALSGAGAPEFELRFGVLRHRRRSAMVWLEAQTVPPALDGLVRALDAALAGCGFAPETRPFRAHVTLARNARRIDLRSAQIDVAWRVRDFCLVTSNPAPTGSIYTVLRRWPLAG